MDANGLRFWLLADEAHWSLSNDDSSGAEYDRERRSLRLARRQPPRPEWSEDEVDALSRLDLVPSSIDEYGTRAVWDAEAAAVLATGGGAGSIVLYEPPAGSAVTDVAIGYDDILYLAVGGDVVLLDIRGRWAPLTVRHDAFNALRLAPDPRGGTWVLDGTGAQLARISGEPLATRPFATIDPHVATPCTENPNPPTLTVLTTAIWPADQIPVAIACSPTGTLVLLTWTDTDARVHFLDGEVFGAEKILGGVVNPFSLTWVTPDRLGVLLVGITEAPVYTATDEQVTLQPVGDIYPLRGHEGGPFLHGVSLPPHYPTPIGSNPLHKLSLPIFMRDGEAQNEIQIDSGSALTEWHRLYVEADIPPRTGVSVFLTTMNDVDEPEPTDDHWYEHRFGASHASADQGVPRGAWVSTPSEIPFHDGMLQCESEPGVAGLFTALIQRSNRRVRTLSGRYLRVRIRFTGDGRSTPELGAVRVYASRFSYLDRYLPRLYRENVFGTSADDVAPSTSADFLGRYLALFESVLTPLEDRIGASYLVTDPRTAPDDALSWLASWIGLSFDSGYPESRRRALLRAAPTLYRWRGTLQGIRLALEVATDGGVSGGEIVVLEDYRLRRTFATILGADLADEDDPLLGGLAVSGNSFVGDTLFLGDEHSKEFLALFGADVLDDELDVTFGSRRFGDLLSERQAVERLFDRLAHRLTVLVHQEVTSQDLGLIRQILEAESPAHVQTRVLVASAEFRIGMASLVGVDTYLRPSEEPGPVVLGESHLGVDDVIKSPGSLDPRLEGGM